MCINRQGFTYRIGINVDSIIYYNKYNVKWSEVENFNSRMHFVVINIVNCNLLTKTFKLFNELLNKVAKVIYMYDK